jgi:phosphopantetheinyl transferase (holo-ACP synthase)
VELGKPEISLTGQAEIVTRENGISRIHLSISHVKDWANAIVVLEKQ